VDLKDLLQAKTGRERSVTSRVRGSVSVQIPQGIQVLAHATAAVSNHPQLQTCRSQSMKAAGTKNMRSTIEAQEEQERKSIKTRREQRGLEDAEAPSLVPPRSKAVPRNASVLLSLNVQKFFRIALNELC
jgi:hypothetical protein